MNSYDLDNCNFLLEKAEVSEELTQQVVDALSTEKKKVTKGLARKALQVFGNPLRDTIPNVNLTKGFVLIEEFHNIGSISRKEAIERGIVKDEIIRPSEILGDIMLSGKVTLYKLAGYDHDQETLEMINKLSGRLIQQHKFYNKYKNLPER